MNKCLQCQATVLEQARFCHQCGASLQPINFDSVNTGAYKAIYSLDFGDLNGLPFQIKSYFLKALRQRLQQELPAANFNDFVDRFHSSGFSTMFDNKNQMLTEIAYDLHSSKAEGAQAEIDVLLDDAFDEMLDVFIRQYGQGLRGANLPESVHQYEEAAAGEIDLQKMIVDFLDLDKESFSYFTEPTEISSIKLSNAEDNFLFAASHEVLLLLCDITVYGSCRKGFALTDFGLYWCLHFNRAHQVQFEDLKIVQYQDEGLNVNNLLFNVNPSVNNKMLHLLKKLKELYV